MTKIGKQTMPIYVLHGAIATITRMMLLQMGINNLFLHLILGILIAWFMSIEIYLLASKFNYSDFLFYPLKYIKIKYPVNKM
jgi:fucose 4-O-acetylase-like acetyltransferase